MASNNEPSFIDQPQASAASDATNSVDEHERHGADPGNPQGEGGWAMLDRMNAGAHERLANWGLSIVEVPADAHMIDIGCGGGANLARLLAKAPEGHATGVDHAQLSVMKSHAYNTEAIEAGRCQVLAGDVRTLPFDDGSFVLATAFETVYFWPEIERAFAEVYRVLAPGGRFLICNETDGTDPEVYDFAATLEGMGVYTNDQLTALLEGAGFTVEVAESEPDEQWARIIARRMA